jgi:predicted Zn finger-like uncharacterized protein
MYTQCPTCQTVFHITMETLQVHSGMVRCGRCDNVFNADQRLFTDIPEAGAEKSAAPKKPRADGPVKAKAAKPKAAGVAKRSTPKPPTPEPIAETPTEEVDAAPAPWSPPPIAERVANEMEPEPVQDRSTYSPAPIPQQRRFSALWLVGAVLLILTFILQSVYFYRDQLAAFPALRPHLLEMCAHLDCRVQPPYDASRIELVQPTNIAPHPRIANALRLRATLVNRASNGQPHPFMQITLTDNAGRVLARRVFAPQQYLEQRASAQNDMPPHLAVSALIDLTNPDGKAVGYQIDFLPPPPS